MRDIVNNRLPCFFSRNTVMNKDKLVGLIRECVSIRDGRLFLPREFHDVIEDLLYFVFCDSIVRFLSLVFIVSFIFLFFKVYSMYDLL